jgi:hypothetical protein
MHLELWKWSYILGRMDALNYETTWSHGGLIIYPHFTIVLVVLLALEEGIMLTGAPGELVKE